MPLLLPSSPAIELRDRFGELQVPVSVGTRWRGWFILDTGSYRSFVTLGTQRRLSRLGIRARRGGEIAPRSLALGGVPVWAASLTALPKAYGDAVEAVGASGVLGMDVLGRYQVGLDAARRILRLWRPGIEGARREWFGTRPVSTGELIQDGPRFRARVDLGAVNAPLLVDTGTIEAGITPALMARIGVGRRVGSRIETFFRGERRIDYVDLPELRWGDVAFAGPVRVGAGDFGDSTGYFGLAILNRTRVLLDYPGRRVFLTGVRRPSPAPFTLTTGDALTLDGHRSGSMAVGKGVTTLSRDWRPLQVPRLWSVARRKDGRVDLIPPKESR